MKISVITVVRNAVDTVEGTIGSVLSQDHSDIEYLVIDGQSTDGTAGVVKRFEGAIDYFVSESDDGLYDAINKGIAQASGEMVGLLHADDEFASSTVLSRVAEEASATGSGAVYGDLVYVDPDHTDRVVRRWQAGAFEPASFRFGWMPPHPTFYVRRELYASLGGYDLAFGSAADYELMLRYLYRHRVRASYIPETMVRMRVGGTSNASVRARIKANAHDHRAWIANGLQPAWYTRYLKPLRKVGQYLPAGRHR